MGKRCMRQLLSKIMALLLVISSFTSLLGYSGHAQAATPLKQVEKQTLAHGALYQVYTKTIDSKTVKVQVVEVDLSHPFVKVAPVYGQQNRIGSKQGVTKMVYENGAIAGLNSSFFRMNNEGGTLGMLVKDGRILSNPAKVAGWNTFAILDNGQAIIEELGFRGQVTAANGQQYPLEGINKTEYFPGGSAASNYSGAIHLFTRDWGPTSIGQLAEYKDTLEVEVVDGYVTAIRQNQGAQAIPKNGYVLFAHGPGSTFLQQHVQIGDPLEVSYTITPSSPSVEQAIGANFLLVENGRPVAQFPTDSALKGKNARSALGINQDGTKLYMVAIDKVNSNPGVTLPELADILIELGSYRGVNLDGGGSTSLAIRELNTMKVTRKSESTWERSVADALAVFNIAPLGQPYVVNISGPQTALVGDSSSYEVQGYDDHYHPLSGRGTTWQETNGLGTVTNNKFTWVNSGTTEVVAMIDGYSKTYPVQVLGAEDIQEIRISPETLIVPPGQSKQIDVEILFKNGQLIKAQPQHLTWSVDATLGQMKGNQFTAAAVAPALASGTITVEVLGQSKTINVLIGQLFDDIKGHWAQKNIEFMAQRGLAKGVKEGQFAPDRSITKAELIVLLSRVLNWQLAEVEQAVKLPEEVPAYAQDALKYAYYHGIIKGDEQGKLGVTVPMTRVEMAAILDRIELPLNLQQQPALMEQLYADWSEVPTWAQASVQALTEKGIFGGIDGQFKPKNQVTRAETITVLKRAFFD